MMKFDDAISVAILVLAAFATIVRARSGEHDEQEDQDQQHGRQTFTEDLADMPTTVTVPADLVPLQQAIDNLEDRVAALEAGGEINPEPPDPQPPDELTPSGDINVSAGQTVEGKLVTGQIKGSGDNIRIRNCQIKHPVGRHGIDIRGGNGLVIENVFLWCSNAPAKGALGAETISVYLERTPGAKVTTVRGEDSSTIIYAVQSSGVELRNIEGRNVRGPFPRGQLVQFNKSPNSKLINFSIFNDLAKSWTEDCINIFESENCLIQKGVLDGCNSQTGVGCMVERGGGTVFEDVDCLHMSNGSFYVYPSTNCTYRRVRTKDSVKDAGRGNPSSNGLVFCSTPDSGGTKFEAAQWANQWNPANILWTGGSCSMTQIAQQDFTPRQQLNLKWGQAPTQYRTEPVNLPPNPPRPTGQEYPDWREGDGPPRPRNGDRDEGNGDEEQDEKGRN